VLDDSAINAFALPGGYVYVTRCILAHLGSKAELGRSRIRIGSTSGYKPLCPPPWQAIPSSQESAILEEEVAMHRVVQEKLEAVKELSAKHRVERLDVFGSAARDDFDPEISDLDFLVEFEPMSPVEHADAFFGLLEDLERLFQRRTDLLEPGPIENPYLWESIVRSRRVLYEAA
jgi:uncharacterized protein